MAIVPKGLEDDYRQTHSDGTVAPEQQAVNETTGRRVFQRAKKFIKYLLTLELDDGVYTDYDVKLKPIGINPDIIVRLKRNAKKLDVLEKFFSDKESFRAMDEIRRFNVIIEELASSGEDSTEIFNLFREVFCLNIVELIINVNNDEITKQRFYNILYENFDLYTLAEIFQEMFDKANAENSKKKYI